MNLNWHVNSFESLSNEDLYNILQLRINVFMIEQNCLYPECDNKDLVAHHLYAKSENKIVAYARLLPPGISYKDASIGRVIVSETFRNYNIGSELMNRAIQETLHFYPNDTIRISAQAHLEKFYQNLGFNTESDEYLEDDIPHIEMAFYHNKKEE